MCKSEDSGTLLHVSYKLSQIYKLITLKNNLHRSNYYSIYIYIFKFLTLSIYSVTISEASMNY
jgi:hypothetical protein